jgi:signal transduction histidine kinase
MLPVNAKSTPRWAIPSMLYKKTAIPLLIIIGSSGTLSILAYYYSLSIADAIGEIASNDIRTNADTQARDLAIILAGGVDSITTNLQILSSSPSVQNYDEDARILFDVSQDSTSQLTHFYMWLDQEGRIEWITNGNANIENFVGLDRSYTEFFSRPWSTSAPFFSDVISTSDNIPRLYIAYPILDKRNQTSESNIQGTFRGVALAAVGLGNIGNMLRTSTPPEVQRNDVILLDTNGIIVYSRDSWLRGKSIHASGDEIIQSGLMDPKILDGLGQSLNQTIEGRAFSADFSEEDGRSRTLSSAPVVVNGQRIWIVNVIAPHSLAADVILLFDQQNIFSTMMVVVFGSLAFGIAFFILLSNRRLSSVINDRTEELRQANNSLEESNTKLANLNRQLLAANEKLLTNDKLQREFINIASHEMKTPTQAILLHSDIARRRPHDSEKSIEAIFRNAERLQRLTGNILDVTRIESQSLKLNKELLDLNELVTTVVSDFRTGAENSVGIIYDGTDISVNADRTRLIQVLSNLLGNAIAFTKNGTVTVAVTKNDDEGSVVVRVRDGGPGIDPEIKSRLFTKFATKSEKGTGLGLFIAKSIIEAHGGQIWAENNQDGIGATFAFSLPVDSLNAKAQI